MSSYNEISREAGSLRKNKQYEEALTLFKQLFEEYKEDCDEFDWWGYSQCLLKLDIYEEALKYSREGLLKYPESAYIKTVYTWSLYHMRIKPEPVNDRDVFFKAANAIVRLSSPDDKYSPLPDTVFKVIDLLELNYDENVQDIFTWLEKLNPEKLSRESFSYTTDEGKQMENASDFERYYAILVKAQQETGRYDECIGSADLIFAELEDFHYGNEVWIRRQRALAYFKTGRFGESLADFKQVLLRKQDWFIKMEMAELYLAMGDEGKALISAVDAAEDPGVSKMKVKLYLFIAKLFMTAGKHYEAVLHARLVISLRAREGWGSDEAAEAIIGQTDSKTELPDDSNALLKLAGKVWSENQPVAERFTGVIKNLLPNGKAGFIKGDDGNDYYFQVRDIRDRKMLPIRDMKVSFSKSESFDRMKNKPSVIAIDIKKG